MRYIILAINEFSSIIEIYMALNLLETSLSKLEARLGAWEGGICAVGTQTYFSSMHCFEYIWILCSI